MTIEGPGGERLRIEVEVNDDDTPADRLLAMLVEGLGETEVVAGPNPFTGQAWPTYTVEGPRAELLTVVVRNVMLTQDVSGAPVLDPGLLADYGELEEAVRLHLGYRVGKPGDGVYVDGDAHSECGFVWSYDCTRETGTIRPHHCVVGVSTEGTDHDHRCGCGEVRR